MHGRRPDLGADRARRRLPSGDLRPRERLHQRHHARPDEARDSASASTRSSTSPSCASSSTRRSRPTRPGMYMRLGFAVAIHVDPDVLLVDEVLAVGDEGFTHKCLDKFAEFRRRGKTILLVTHSLGLVERFCDEALWLDGGRVRWRTAIPRRVVDAYLTAVEKGEEELLAATTAKAVAAVAARAAPGRSAGRAAAASPTASCRTCSRPSRDAGDRGRWRSPTSRSSTATAAAVVRLSLRRADVGAAEGRGPRAGRRLRLRRQPVQRRRRLLLRHEHVSRGNGAGAADGEAEVTFAIDSLDLVEGTYKLDVAVHKCDGYPYDYHRLLYTFRVKSRTHDVGIYRPRHHWTFSPGVRFKARRSRGRAIVTRWPRRSAACVERAPRGRQDASSSPTACSTCCIPATSATSSRRAALGDALIVGVNSDRSVRANKGAGPSDHAGGRARRDPRGARSGRCASSSSTRTRRTRSSRRFSRTCSSRAPTGPRTPSSAAISSKRAAAGSSGCRSSRAIRRPRSSRRFVRRVNVATAGLSW